jgi:hypothetical protein
MEVVLYYNFEKKQRKVVESARPKVVKCIWILNKKLVAMFDNPFYPSLIFSVNLTLLLSFNDKTKRE